MEIQLIILLHRTTVLVASCELRGTSVFRKTSCLCLHSFNLQQLLIDIDFICLNPCRSVWPAYRQAGPWLTMPQASICAANPFVYYLCISWPPFCRRQKQSQATAFSNYIIQTIRTSFLASCSPATEIYPVAWRRAVFLSWAIRCR